MARIKKSPAVIHKNQHGTRSLPKKDTENVGAEKQGRHYRKGRARAFCVYTVFHAKRVDCAIFHLLVYISGILHARPTYDISSRSPIFGDHFDTNDKVSHDSHVTQLAEEVTRF